jgi:hypothetical protein
MTKKKEDMKRATQKYIQTAIALMHTTQLYKYIKPVFQYKVPTEAQVQLYTNRVHPEKFHTQIQILSDANRISKELVSCLTIFYNEEHTEINTETTQTTALELCNTLITTLVRGNSKTITSVIEIVNSLKGTLVQMTESTPYVNNIGPMQTAEEIYTLLNNEKILFDALFEALSTAMYILKINNTTHSNINKITNHIKSICQSLSTAKNATLRSTGWTPVAISIDNVEKYANILNNFDDAIKLTDKIAEILYSRLLP